jgi:predicted membrane chloride channel (bestrophin family)
MARHLAALGWILKASVRGESIDLENEVLGTMLSGHTSKDFQWVAAQPKRTVALLSRVRQLAASAMSVLPDTARMSAALLLIEERIAELELCVGGCDRLFTSPIPPTYSRHLSRVMFLWLFLLPMSLAALNLHTLGIMLPTAVATYVLVGIDEVGMEIENAFQLLPLQQLAAAAQNGVRDQIVPASGPMPECEF